MTATLVQLEQLGEQLRAAAAASRFFEISTG